MGSQQSSNVTIEQRTNDSAQPSTSAEANKMNPSEQQSNKASEQEKCYDSLQDSTLIFVDGEDDHDFECNDFKSRRAKMSCGHTVTPMSLTNWCKQLLGQGEIRFVCGQPGCNVEWPYDEVWKMALLTPEEMEYFEKKMFRAAKEYLDVKSCPGCKSFVERRNVYNLRVHCVMCKAEKKRAFSFCWQCLEEWKGPAPRSDRCENRDCQNPLDILRNCPDITFERLRGVSGCPSTRACPTCGLLVDHNKKGCKYIGCQRCNVVFCFVCLKLTKECLEQEGSSYFVCCPVAPRQTTITVWQRK